MAIIAIESSRPRVMMRRPGTGGAAASGGLEAVATVDGGLVDTDFPAHYRRVARRKLGF